MTLRICQISDHPTVDFAVKEAVRLLSRMDPDLEITVNKASYSKGIKDVIWIGVNPAFRTPCENLSDTVKIEVNGLSGIITGSNFRSVLIAVYRFLRELGCRFTRPGKNGEKIPRKDLRNMTVSVLETASYRHRGVCIEGADSYENIRDMIDFLPKVGMNEYFIQFMIPTEFFARWYEHRNSTVLRSEWGPDDDPRKLASKMTSDLEVEIKKRSLIYHKVGHGWTCEPFGISGDGWSFVSSPLNVQQKSVLAEVNGKRELWGGIPLNTNLCYSNDLVRKTVTDAITDYAANNPQIDIIHFWLADGSNNHCECPNCVKRRPADWYVKMLNELDEKMTAANLKTKIVFLIYVDLLWSPESEKIKNKDRFILMFAPITRKYGQSYGDCMDFRGKLPGYVRNKLKMPHSLEENVAHLKEWQKQFDGDSFAFDYHLMWAHVGDLGYEKCARNLFDDMKDLRKLGLCGMVSCQIQRCFFPTALPFISMAAALWNEKADFDSVANDYYRSEYGPQGQLVREAMQTLSSGCRLYEKETPIWNEDEATRGSKMLSEAVRNDPSLEDLASYIDYLDRLFELLRALSSNDVKTAEITSGDLFEWMWKNEEKLQGILDVHNSVGTINRLISGIQS